MQTKIGGGIIGGLGGGLILMPILLGMNAFAPLTMEPTRPVEAGSLIGHLSFGFILGATYMAVTLKGGGRIHFKEKRPTW